PALPETEGNDTDDESNENNKIESRHSEAGDGKDNRGRSHFAESIPPKQSLIQRGNWRTPWQAPHDATSAPASATRREVRRYEDRLRRTWVLLNDRPQTAGSAAGVTLWRRPHVKSGAPENGCSQPLPRCGCAQLGVATLPARRLPLGLSRAVATVLPRSFRSSASAANQNSSSRPAGSPAVCHSWRARALISSWVGVVGFSELDM